MVKVSKFLIVSLLCLFVCVSIASADSWWYGTAGDHDWSNVANWVVEGVPTSSSVVNVAASDSTYALRPIINVTAAALDIHQAGHNASHWEPAVIDVVAGAAMTVTNWYIGNDATLGILNISGGQVDIGTFYVASGTAWPNTGGLAEVNLDGGELGVTTLDIGASGVIDITAGTLRLAGDATDLIAAYMLANKITAYNGQGTVVVTYDNTNTFVTATPEPATMLILGLGSLFLARRKK
jgi:hypothetical protein